MGQVVEIINNNIVAILIGLIGIVSIFLILIIILFAKNRKLKKKYKSFMRGTETDLESLLIESMKKSDQVQDSHQHIKQSIENIEDKLKSCLQKVGTVRYNAVPGVGSDLCFAIALLDQEDNGVVINGIYTRDGSYTYAKAIVKGESIHVLSEEEKEAIRIAKG